MPKFHISLHHPQVTPPAHITLNGSHVIISNIIRVRAGALRGRDDDGSFGGRSVRVEVSEYMPRISPEGTFVQRLTLGDFKSLRFGTTTDIKAKVGSQFEFMLCAENSKHSKPIDLVSHKDFSWTSATVQSSKMTISIEGPLNKKNTNAFAERAHFDEIYIRDQETITVDIAKKLLPLRSVFKMTLWCDITRAAMQHVISRPNLNELVVFELKPFGSLSGFEYANSLTYFSCVCGLTEADLLELAECRSLEKLGAQQASITERALEALLELPLLTEIDFEDSNFNDNHASLVAQSKTITKLDVGQCHITKDGLKKICSMKQLKELDIWSNNIEESDLDLLSGLPNLEYLSIGGSVEQTAFTAKGTIPKLEKISSLKHLWLDGLKVSNDEWAYLNKRYKTVKLAAIHMK